MLDAPADDPGRLALDRAVADAVVARVASGARGRIDADAIALRVLLTGVPPVARPAVRALLGRIEATVAPPLTVHGPLSRALAADRFGMTFEVAVDTAGALAAAADGRRALIDLDGAWWGRLLATPGLRVVLALPDDAAGQPRALMISREPSGPTGDDRTFWVTDSRIRDDAILAALGAAGLAAQPPVVQGGLKLFALAGYVQANDPRLADLPGALSGVIGAAPVF